MSQHFGFTSEPSQPLDFTSSGLPSLPNSAFSSHYLFPLPVPPQSAFATTSIDAFCFNTSIIPYHSQSHQDNILVSPASPSSQESELEEDCSSMSSAHLLPLGDPSLMQAYSQSTCSLSSTDIDSDPSQPMPGSPSSSDDSSSCLDGLPSFELGMPPPLPGTTILERSASATSMSSLPPLPIPFTSLTVDGAGRTSRDLSPPSYSNSFSSFSTPYVSTTNSLPLPYTPSTAYVPVMPAVVTPTPQAPTATASPAPNPFHPYSTRQKKRERPQPEVEIHEAQKTQPVSSRPLSKSSSHRAEAKRPAPSSPDGFPALCPFVEINDGVGVSGFNGPCPLNDYFVSLSHREWAAMDENASQSRRSAKCRMRVTITVPPSASQPGAELTLALCLNHGGGAAAKDRKYDAAFLTLPTVGPNGQPSYAVIRSRPEKRRSVWIVSASEANKFKHTVPSAMSLDQRGEYGLWFYNLPEGVEDYQVEVEVGTIAGCRARELAVDQNPSKKQKPSKSRS